MGRGLVMQSPLVAPPPSVADSVPVVGNKVWLRLDQAQRWVRVTATLLLVAGLLNLGFAAAAMLLIDFALLAHVVIASAVFVACMFLIPAIILFRYAIRIRIPTRTKATSHLLIAFHTQERLWAFVTALLMIYLALWAISAVYRATVLRVVQ